MMMTIRVLRAYALRNPAIGYCQGMNFIAGLLLAVVPEETAFWLLSYFCEEVNPGYYSPPMLGTRADVSALKEMIQSELPDLYHHCLHHHQLALELWATPWLIVHFVNAFPAHTALRVLEVVMLEGSDATFAMSLAFLRMLQPALMGSSTCDFTDLIETLRSHQSGMYDADRLLEAGRRELDRIRPKLRPCRAWHLR